jgi:dTDP-4-dehydrorhamnose reductase
MVKIIVTGANGQLGNEIKDLSSAYNEYEFVYTDIDSLDLLDKEAVELFMTNEKPDYVINCAAYTAVDKAETDDENARRVNSEMPGMLSELALKYTYNLIHISTDYVFSGNHFRPINEEAETNPQSVYGKTKLKGEKMVLDHSDAVIIRTSWLYSIHGNNFVKSMIRLGREREALGVVYDQAGTPTNAADLANSILRIIQQCEVNNTWHSGVYHFSNEGVCSWYDFAVEIMNIANIDCKVSPILSSEYPVPAPRPAYSVLDKHKIKNTFNLSIPHWKPSLIKALNTILKENI